MPTNHTCKDGDCLSSIAAQNGLPSIQPLQDINGDLKKNRPSPNLLAVGDVVKVPDKKPKEADAASGKSTKFTAKVPKADLKVYLRGVVGEKLANAKCVVKVGGEKGFTKDVDADGDGLISLAIPADAPSATIEVALPEPPKPEKPPDDGLEIPKETFTLKDEKEDPAAKREVLKKLVWNVTLGTLHPIGPQTDAANAKAFITGAQRRLHNLGFEGVGSSGLMDEVTKKALAAVHDRGGFKEDTPLGQKTADELANKHDKGAT